MSTVFRRGKVTLENRIETKLKCVFKDLLMLFVILITLWRWVIVHDPLTTTSTTKEARFSSNSEVNTSTKYIVIL